MVGDHHVEGVPAAQQVIGVGAAERGSGHLAAARHPVGLRIRVGAGEVHAQPIPGGEPGQMGNDVAAAGAQIQHAGRPV